jgi:hypothetical protein
MTLQTQLAIVTSPTLPYERVTIGTSLTDPNTYPPFYLGETIVLGAYVTNSGPGQVSCVVDFYAQQANLGSCNPIQIASNIMGSGLSLSNPTAGTTLNAGAAPQLFEFEWIVEGQTNPPLTLTPGAVKFFAQARCVNAGSGALAPPCTTDAWNASRGIMLLSTPTAIDKAIYKAVAFVNRAADAVHSWFKDRVWARLRTF